MAELKDLIAPSFGFDKNVESFDRRPELQDSYQKKSSLRIFQVEMLAIEEWRNV